MLLRTFYRGGALLWSINNRAIKQIAINDNNPDLINLYRTIRDDLETLLIKLRKFNPTKAEYYKVRFWDRNPSFNRRHPATKAARTLFLNKTGYNGLYRVNSKGQNNVPFGNYKNPTIVDEPNLRACSEYLQGVEVSCGDFEEFKPRIDRDAFVYLDPPYVPLTPTSGFTSYTQEGFDKNAQERLKLFCDHIDNMGAKFMLSNSSAPLCYELYSDYNIEEVLARRSINSKGEGRGEITELIVRNYG